MKKRIVSILLASAMALNLTAVPTLAAEPVIEVINNISEEEISLEAPNKEISLGTSAEEIIADEIVEADQQTAPQEEQPSDESLPIIIEETPSADAPTSPSADAPASPSADAPETTPSDEVSATPIPDESPAEEITLNEETKSKLEDLFPGLPEDYILTEEQIEDKQVLKEHVAEAVDIAPSNPEEPIDIENIKDLTDDSNAYVPGELVYLTESQEEAETIAKAFNAEIESFDQGVLVLELPENVTTAQAVVAAADEEINLPAVWPNFYSYLEESINATEPYLSPFSSKYQYMHEFVGSEKAWAAGYTGKDVRVAVIDSGCIDNHIDLKNNIIPGTDITTNTTRNVDEIGHGTAIAGIIAAENNGSLGAGIAPEARVKCFKVIADGKTSATNANIAKGINAAVSEGFDIISISLGSYNYDASLETACKNAYEAGVVVFCSAGNEAFNGLHYPSSYATTVCVGALDKSGAMADFTNYGSGVDFSFPGVGIYSLNKENVNDYTSKSGTSFATPIAAGVAAVIISKIKGGRSKSRVDKVISIMKDAAKASPSSGMGAGYTYLPKALGISGQDEPVETIPAPTIETDVVRKKGDVYEAKVVKLTIKIPYSASQSFVFTTNGTEPSLSGGVIKNGLPLYGTVEDDVYTANLYMQSFASITLKIATLDSSKGELSKIVTKQFNLRPFAESIEVYPSGQSNVVRRKGTITLKAKFTPSYTYDKSVKWVLSDEAKDEGIKVDKYTGKITIGSKTEEGSYIVTAIAKDSDGDYNGPSCDYEIYVTREAAYVKTITTKKSSKNINILDNTTSLEEYIRINGKAIDAGEVVWSSSKPSVAAVDPSTGIITPYCVGTTKIKAMATDGTRKTATITVKIVRHAESVTVTGPTTVIAGKVSKFKASVLPADTTNKKVKWTCDAPKKYIKVASNGYITVSSKCPEGTYRITATDKYGTEGHLDFTVSKGYITSIKFDEKSVTLFTNGNQTSKTLKVTVNGKKNFDEKAIKYSSSNVSVVTVDSYTGLAIARGAGTATITCKSTDGTNKSSTVKVNVSAPVTNIAVSPSIDGGFKETADKNYILLAKGGSRKLVARCTSAYGKIASGEVEWSVSDTTGKISIASDGTLSASSTAVTGSTTVVTAKAKDGSLCQSTALVKIVDKYDKAVFKPCVVDGGIKGYALYPTSSATNAITYALYTISGDSKATLNYDPANKCYKAWAISATTTKSSADYPSGGTSAEKEKFVKDNGIKCTVTAKIMDGSGVSISHDFYVCKTSDGSIYYMMA